MTEIRSLSNNVNKSKKGFTLVGYTGKILEQGMWKGIYALNGMTSKNNVTILFAHDHTRIIGKGKAFLNEDGFCIRGHLTDKTDDGQMVINLLKEDIDLQCSIGVETLKMHLSDGTEIINGIIVPEGVQIISDSFVGETSIVAWGADNDTSITKEFAKEIIMTEEIKTDEDTLEEVVETPVVDEKEEIVEEAPEVVVEEIEEVVVETPVVEEIIEEVVVEDTPEVVVEEIVEPKEFSKSDLDAAVTAAISAEHVRVKMIFAAGAPTDLTQIAITDGLDELASIKMFYKAEITGKDNALKALAASAPAPVNVNVEEEITASKEAGYIELIGQAKMDHPEFSASDAMAFVVENHPKAYQKYILR